MKEKLATFSRFTEKMLPHEIDYLLRVQSFEDGDRMAILKRMRHNCEPLRPPIPYDDAIDKRKYSHLKNWIQQRLAAIDVDQQYQWLSQVDESIMTGDLAAEEEQEILKRIAQQRVPAFHFVKWYDMLRNYRQFLLTRMRYQPYGQVIEYLGKQQAAYQRAQRVQEEMHLALLDIVRYYTTAEGQPRRWAPTLTEWFFDTRLDGHSRHEALTLLSILHVSTRTFGALLELLDAQDACLQRGEMYAPRLLVTYYANRLILCTRFDELAEAERFGYLSLRADHPNQLQYRSNLAAVLLRRDKAREAHDLLKPAFSQMKKSVQAHDKTSFVVMYLRTLLSLGQFAQGERYADAFLKGNQALLFEHRWHAFFHATFRLLFAQEKYKKVLKLIRKFELIARESHPAEAGRLLPFMSWYELVSRYKEGKCSREQLEEALVESLRRGPSRVADSFDLLKKEMRTHLTLELEGLKSRLQTDGSTPESGGLSS